MSTYSWPPKSGGGIQKYATFAAFPANPPDGTLILALDTDTLYAYNAGMMSYVIIGGASAVVTIGTIDSQSPGSNGATLNIDALIMQSASTSFPGLVNLTTQSFAGNKTFTGSITASNFSGTSSGTNTGDVTLTAAGAIPNANGASLSGQILTLQPANTSFPGVLLAADWNTFNNKQDAGNYITALTGDASASGPGSAALTLATVNVGPGSFGGATAVPTITVNGKGLVTASSSTSIQIAESQVTNLVSDLAGKQPTGNYITALTGDVTAAGPGSSAATIATNAVTNTKLAQIPAHSYKGNNTGSTANAADITSTQLTADLNLFSSTLQGLTPASGGGTTNFLRADGTFAAPPSTGGTVTSVALADGSNTPIFTISGSPVTTSGTLTFTLNNETANKVFAGPATGSPDQPTFRSLVAADLPAGTGTVTSVSVTTANGVSGSVATATTTPAITLTLGAITPSSIVASGSISGSNLSGTNTGDQTITLTSDVTGSGTGSFATTIANNAVTNAKAAQMAAHTFKGNNTGSTANALDLTATQLTAELNTFTSTLQGLVPASGGGTTTFLRADGTFAAPSGTGTVTSVSVVSANGLAGTVATATTTPAITLSTSITGILQGDGTAISAATTTGSGSVVLATSPTLVTPALGTPSALVGTNITGTAAGLTAGTVTTNANLTGVITSVGNATSIASQTGTGSTFVVQTSPTLVTPNLGTPSALVLTNATGLPIAGGGTGQSTKAAAFDALSPMTTGGDLIYGGASGTGTRLANGSAGQVLQSNGTTLAPTWVTNSSSNVSTASTSSNASFFPLFVASSTNSSQAVNLGSGLSFNPSTNLLSTTGFLSGAGAVGSPAYSFTGDSDTGIFNPSANQCTIATKGASRLRISDLGTGFFTPDANNVALSAVNNDTTGSPTLQVTNLTSTAASSSVAMSITFDNMTDATNSLYIKFGDSNTGTTGSVAAASASTVSFNTSSDARLKTAINYNYNASDLVKLMTPCEYEYIKAPGQKRHGFIAQELYTTFPEAVSPGDAEIIEDQPFNPWMIDYSKLTGVLCKAVKELVARVESLEAEVEILKNK